MQTQELGKSSFRGSEGEKHRNISHTLCMISCQVICNAELLTGETDPEAKRKESSSSTCQQGGVKNFHQKHHTSPRKFLMTQSTCCSALRVKALPTGLKEAAEGGPLSYNYLWHI